MKLYCIVDTRAKSIVSTFQSVNDAAAERSFLSLLSAPRGLFADFPEDFALYPLADLSFDNGVVVSMHNAEELRKNGFTVGSYVNRDAVKLGSDYDKRYLAVLREDIYSRYPVTDNKEVSEDA